MQILSDQPETLLLQPSLSSGLWILSSAVFTCQGATQEHSSLQLLALMLNLHLLP